MEKTGLLYYCDVCGKLIGAIKPERTGCALDEEDDSPRTPASARCSDCGKILCNAHIRCRYDGHSSTEHEDRYSCMGGTYDWHYYNWSFLCPDCRDLYELRWEMKSLVERNKKLGLKELIADSKTLAAFDGNTFNRLRQVALEHKKNCKRIIEIKKKLENK